MALRKRFALGKIAVVAAVSGALTINPAMAEVAPLVYMESTNNAATIEQVLAAGDKYGLTWEGVPDGMGAIRNGDGTVTVFVNHELSASDSFISAIERQYGGFGSNITAVKFNPSTGEVIKISNAIKSAVWYDYTTGKYGKTPEAPLDAPNVDSFGTPNHSKAINRFCSATLVDAGGFFYKTKKGGFGTKDPIFLTGEEGADESRAFALNVKTKQLVQLPALGLGAVENIGIADVKATKKTTVAVVGEDGESTSSQLFVYKGTKTKTGNWYKRAGLTNGTNFVTRVLNSGTTIANDYNVRTAMADKTVVSAIKGANPVATTKVKIVEGQLTITTAAVHNVKVGDKVTLSGFGSVTDANSVTLDLSVINGPATITAVGSTTAFTFGVDLDNLAETAYVNGGVAIGANQVVVTTSAAHGLIEGDTVSFAGVTGLTGRYTVTGVPTGSTTVFTVKQTGDAFSSTGGTVNEILDVEFKAVPTDLAGDAQQAIAQLRGTVFARVEDLSFNPANPNELFFVTTQSDSVTAGTGFPGTAESGRDGGGLWKLTFVNVAKPELGANLELILDGTEAPLNDAQIKLNKPDNMTFSNDGQYVMVQEDPGANNHIARLLALRLSDKALVSVAQFDPTYFSSSNVDSFLTNDEESSGIFDATKYFKLGDGASYFMFNAQVHPVTRDGGGNSLGTDPLKARAAALLRPDLIAQTNFTITNINHVASATTMTVTVTDTGELAANDIVTIFGGTAEVNGTYSVTSVNPDADTFTVTVKNTVTLNGDLNVGNGLLSANAKAITTSLDEDLAFKASVFEGGGLYTLKIEDWDALFNVVG